MEEGWGVWAWLVFVVVLYSHLLLFTLSEGVSWACERVASRRKDLSLKLDTPNSALSSVPGTATVPNGVAQNAWI